MSTWSRGVTRFAALFGVGLVTMLTASARADAQHSRGGFLFGTPDGTLTFRGGYARPTAGSDLFGFATSELTLAKGDFAGLELGADLGIMHGQQWEWLLSVDASTRSAESEYRAWTGSDGKPINQSTTFTRVPVLLGVRYYLRSPGTSIGRLAWIPASWVPWVAVQGGVMWYRFAQTGEFVNFANGNAVFAGDLESTGWAPTAAFTAGVNLNLTPTFALVTQGRYVYARKTLGPDFTGFQPIDLTGGSVTAGLIIRIR